MKYIPAKVNNKFFINKTPIKLYKNIILKLQRINACAIITI
jgi:hypothetical protein